MWKGKNGNLGAVPPAGFRGKPPGVRSGGEAPPKLMTLFVKICYFVTVLRCVHGYTNQFNMKRKKNQFGRRKVTGEQQLWATGRPASRPP